MHGMKKGSRQNLADQVRQRVIASNVSQHQIARDTGIKQPGLSKFMNGGSLKIETLDLLLNYFHVGLSEAEISNSNANAVVCENKRRYGEDSISFGKELEGLEGKTFSTILIDPPWRFQNRTGKMAPEHRRLNRYETMELNNIKQMPVAAHCNKTCHLYMWCPNALLKEGLEVMDAWGFKYKTNLVWYKVRKDGGPDGRGVGFYFRNVTELILFGVRGSMRTLDPGRRQVNIISTRKREHSRKPAETYELIEQCSPGPYLEIFAREPAKGWTSWGNEVETYEDKRPLHKGYNNQRKQDLKQLTLSIT
jgi:N6-adenosine-specific RNA methylase IME4/predicted XRE-type DNA-binding protein